ncbi:hypothetical protein MaudCBS49596_007782 [Microsporum audouinii]
MLHHKTYAITLLLPLLLSPVFAEDANLVGCKEVSCPKYGSNDRCMVEDKTFLGVGLSHIPDVPSALKGFSLVKGVNVSAADDGADNDKPTRPFKSVYYLAVPEKVETKGLTSCAVIFNISPSKKFKGPRLEGNAVATDTRAATGVCSDVVEQRCIDTITQRAKNATEIANGNACEALERELQKGPFDGCDGFSGQGSLLANFTVKPLGDLNAVKNSTDCWPVQQKSDKLMEITEVTSYATYTVDALINEAYKITPILTVFVSKNGSFVDSTSAQMTCLKVVTQEIPTEDNHGAKNLSAAVRGGWLTVGMAVLMGVFIRI